MYNERKIFCAARGRRCRVLEPLTLSSINILNRAQWSLTLVICDLSSLLGLILNTVRLRLCLVYLPVTTAMLRFVCLSVLLGLTSWLISFSFHCFTLQNSHCSFQNSHYSFQNLTSRFKISPYISKSHHTFQNLTTHFKISREIFQVYTHQNSHCTFQNDHYRIQNLTTHLKISLHMCKLLFPSIHGPDWVL